MRYLKPFFFVILFLQITPAFSQKLKKAEKEVISRLKTHVTFLADDKLEGRRAGTPGEQLAGNYIKHEFDKAGLIPKGDNGTYIQAFRIDDGKSYENSFLFINDHEVKQANFFPLSNSPEVSLESAPSIALKEAGIPWFLNLTEDLHDVSISIHFDVIQHIGMRAREAAKKGAKALIVYQTGDQSGWPRYADTRETETLPIPVILVDESVAKKYFADESATLDIKLKIKFKDNLRTAHNIIGFIDNGAAQTIVAGAHYDHLGYGEDGNSLQRTPEKLIHNGADDNASGVAALIELSKMVKKGKLKNNNYLFIAFSGEEGGLLGSKYFVDHPTINLSAVNYMINMDMIGRLDENNKVLILGGYGTSPQWASVVPALKKQPAFSVKYDSTGAGPSDHTSFYTRNIPVLFFFTGVHADYHKPTDDFDKINYTGIYRVLEYVYGVIEGTNNKGRLVFTKTRDLQPGTNASFSVGLGIMPDYSYNGSGVRIDAISSGRAAEKAGLKTGDIVIQLGNNTVSSLENYMRVLSSFKKGDSTTVKVKRANETIQANVIF